MAKQLSMEDMIKKYKYLRTTQQTSSTNFETKQKSQEKDNGEFSKSSSIGTSAGFIASNPYPESSISSEATSSEDACKVCLDSEANCAFIECGHIVSCLNCAKSLTRCPVCRAVIKRTLRVYKS